MSESTAAEDRIIYVYALIDPRDGRTRYVGQSYNPVGRLKGHLKEARVGSMTPKCSWLRELLSLKLKPTVKILFEGSEAVADVFESSTIQLMKAHDNDLTNVDARRVGKGQRGSKRDEAARKRISDGTKQQMTSERCQALSEIAKQRPDMEKNFGDGFLGRTHTEEARQKISIANKGKPQSESTRRAVGESNSRRVWTSEMRANMSMAQRGKKRSDETKQRMSEAQRAYRARMKESE